VTDTVLAVVRHMSVLAAAQQSQGRTDQELLQDYLLRNDRGAFAALVKRHGPMVLGVCRRQLRSREDADDAFQAAFLLLAQKAATIRKRESLASWLHGVAYRMGQNAKRAAIQRRKHEGKVSPIHQRDPAEDVAWREVQGILDAEVGRLPAAHRAPFLLCFIEGRGRAEAAVELGLTEKALEHRLRRARVLLRDRLARRGVSLTAILTVAAMNSRAGAAVPSALLNGTLDAVTVLATGGAVPAKVAAFMKGASTAMFMSKIKTLLVCALALLGGAGWGASALMSQPPTVQPARPQSAAQPKPNPSVSSATSGTSLTVERIKSNLKEQRDNVQSLYVEYKITIKPLVETELLPRWGLLDIYPYEVEEHVGVKESKRYFRTIQTEPLKLIADFDKVDPKAPEEVQKIQKQRMDERKKARDTKAQIDDAIPPRDRTNAYDGKTAWKQDGRGGEYTIFPAGMDARIFSGSQIYLANVGLRYPDPTNKNKAFQGYWNRYLLPEGLDALPYRVLPGTEKVDGDDCVVLEAKKTGEDNSEMVDKLWLDLHRGLALRRRDTLYDGLLVERRLNSKFEEVIPGAWLPKQSQWQRAAPKYAPKEYHNKIAFEYRVTVLKWSANDVKDALFEIPPGARRP
jgi:RNA polymerase sigma factor (sigma-70 family)